MVDESLANALAKQRHLEMAVHTAKLMLWLYYPATKKAVSAAASVPIAGLPKDGMDNLPETLFPYLEDSSIPILKKFYKELDEGIYHAQCEIWYKPRDNQAALCTSIIATRVREKEQMYYYCLSQDITLEKAAQQQYDTVMAGIMQDSAKFISIASINITRDTLNSVFSTNYFVKELQSIGSYAKIVSTLATKFVDKDARNTYLQTCSPEALLKQYASGIYQNKFRFRCKLSTGGIHWLEVSYYLAKNPLTGDIEGVSYVSDVNREVLRDNALRRLTDWDFECIALIELVGHEYIYLSRNQDAHKILPRAHMWYDDEIKFVAENMVVPEQKEDYLNNILLEPLRKNLKKTPHFSYTVSVKDEDGVFHSKLLHYSYMDETKQAILLTAMDVTESFLQHQEELKAVRASIEREEKALQYRNLFFSNISHDMRTPLNGILGFTDLAMQETDAEKMRQYLSKIKLSGGLLLDLINDTLMLSKLESGKLKPSYEIIDNRLISGRILVPIKAMADAKGVELIQDRSRSPHVMLKADRINTQKIFLNLISNAVKFTPKGGRVTVLMEQMQEPRYNCNYRFVVKDTGIGINPKFLPHIYEPFVQENVSMRLAQPQAQGTGLGLAIVKQLVELLQGRIEVESEVGKGTTFTVYLPMPVVKNVSGEPEWVPGAAPLKVTADLAKPKAEGTYKVLLCEDNYLNMEIATTLLRKKHYKVLKAVNGQEGVDIFKASKPNEIAAILMDLRMPVLNGYEATEAIRDLERDDAKMVPIIALSADAYAEDVEKALMVGMNAHLAKPYNTIEFFSVLEKLINERYTN